MKVIEMNLFKRALLAYLVLPHAWAFHAPHTWSYGSHCNQRKLIHHDQSLDLSLYAKGFGGGLDSKSPKKTKPLSKEAVMRRIRKTYGGTSPEEIASATQRRIEKALGNLPPHMSIATQLYQQVKKSDAYMARLSLLEQANLPEQAVQVAELAKAQLGSIMREHAISEADIHNILQKATWDASATAKAARSLTGEMPQHIAERVDHACSILASALKDDDSRCLDVGCGFGVLVPHLIKAGIKRQQISGVDLSEEMIRNALELHPGIDFRVTEFIERFEDKAGFDGIIFCSALHDFPDLIAALKKAASLLRSQGTLIIVHPQGGIHVANQVASNPILVKRNLPSADELAGLGSIGLELVVAPAAAGSIQDSNDGYLAVLRKTV